MVSHSNLGDICPKIPVLVQLVWPYRRGEIATQYYNAILSLGQLLREESSYGLIFHENDILHRACTSRQLQHRLSRFIGQVPLVELNRLMSHLLGGVLQVFQRLCILYASRQNNNSVHFICKVNQIILDCYSSD